MQFRGWQGWLLGTLMMTAGMRAEILQVYVGTYTGPKSEGIYGFRFDTESGVIESRGLVAKSKSPSFLALHPSGRFLYSANEADQWNGKPG
ncbi:MAG: beta-propeller fold lactonase family protein, partial [Verrucomicrobiae bacterium]|nr:beta-propeller fold lactonase family protein [Verrucomicrobiae bacterium]